MENVRIFVTMKRTMPFHIAFVAVFFAVGCARPLYVAKSDIRTARMQGCVSQTRETLFENTDDATRLPATLSASDTYTEVTYNRAGNITLLESFQGPDTMKFVKEEYLYDSTGQRMLYSLSHDLARGTVITVRFDYDTYGNMISAHETTGASRIEYSYDRLGYPIEEIGFSYGDSLNSVTRYRYDARGRLRRAKDGDIVRRYSYYPDGAIAKVRTGKRDTERYDEKGNIAGMESIVVSRNEKGRIEDKFPITITAEYEYDGHGNWTKRTLFYKGEVQSVRVRRTDYYDVATEEDERR